MNILMFGTGPFAVPTLVALLRSRHTIQGLVTRPIDDPGQRRKTAANPMRDLAEQQGLAIFDPPDVNAAESVATLAGLGSDLFVVCDYGQILSDDCLTAARLGGINLHGSLLPKYRGAAPIQWAIYRGESMTGVSVILMTSRLDGGPILLTREIPIGPRDTAVSLESSLSALGAEAVLESLDRLECWDGVTPIGQPQDPQRVTTARRLRKDDGLLRWQRTATQIERQVRAFTPWPGVYTFWQRPQGEPLRLIVNHAEVVTEATPATSDAAQPGRIHAVAANRLLVETGQGHVSLLEVQPAGKKSMPIDAFLRGYPLAVGQFFVESPQRG